MHEIAYSVRFISKIFTGLGKLPFLGPQAVKNAFSWGWINLVQFFISHVSKSGVRLFPYYLLAYIMPPLYKP